MATSVIGAAAVTADRGMEGRGMAGVDGSLASRLDHLFDKIRRPDGKPYSYEQVAEAIRSQQGVGVTHTYIWRLHKGKSDNPTIKVLIALATFFAVPVTYFLDPQTADDVDEVMDRVALLHDAGVARLAFRAAGLSTPSLETLATMADLARKIEGKAAHNGDEPAEETPEPS
ncbi:helix-turn-helix domain-containing protein [Micromonospora sp. Llam0]|uniref:helix-turn-helix domain-containing protein n=1 Tax=Micromonospora sp. Llam0 TaxID=2485143 RepID=UPI0018F52A27|nr:helix-turn-helix domain-containing protein [Micromonospora sp. Llam0]